MLDSQPCAVWLPEEQRAPGLAERPLVQASGQAMLGWGSPGRQTPEDAAYGWRCRGGRARSGQRAKGAAIQADGRHRRKGWAAVKKVLFGGETALICFYMANQWERIVQWNPKLLIY